MYDSSSSTSAQKRALPAKRTTLVAGAALALLAAGSAGSFSSASAHGNHHAQVHVFHGPLRDLQLTTVEPFEGARAQLRMLSEDGHTWFTLKLRHVDRSAAGQEFGAHLHLGPCVTGDGAAALGHYNTDVLAGVTPPAVNDTTEVWLDFLVERNGSARSVAYVPFVPIPGNRAIVIHEHETDATGAAGNRLSCLPVSW